MRETSGETLREFVRRVVNSELKPEERETTCLHCPGVLDYVAGYGWIHKGASALLMRCSECGWFGGGRPLPTACPHCGSKNLRDDHVATPRRW